MELFGAKLQYEAAMKYYKGDPKHGYSRNRKKAFKLFEEAANAGLVEAMMKLSECLLSGIGCKPDYEESLIWMERAASKGNAEAQYQVGVSYMWRYKKSEFGCEWLEKAAHQGHVQAMLALGQYYTIGSMDQPEKAIEWLSKPALSDNPEAIYLLATAYDYCERRDLYNEYRNKLGDEIEDPNFDYDEFCKKRDEAIENHPYSNKVNNLYKKALRLYEEQVSFGDLKCALEAAGMYLHGLGCEVNEEKAFDYYSRIAHQPESLDDCNNFCRDKAILTLAKMYELGIGCEQDLDKCHQLMKEHEIDEEIFKNYTI